MTQHDLTPEDIERLLNMPRPIAEPRHTLHHGGAYHWNGQHEDWDQWDLGYRAFFEGKPQSGKPEYSAWARGWEYAQLEDDDD